MKKETLAELAESYWHPRKGFFTRTRAETWPHGLLIGNGTLGATVMGHPQKECLIVNHEELFLPTFERLPVLGMVEFLPQIRQLIDDGQYDDAMNLVIDKAAEAGYPTDFIMTDPSHPAFDLLLDFGAYGGVAEYLRSVNFETGEASIQFCGPNGEPQLRRSFVSRADGVLVVEILADQPISVEVNLGTRPFSLESWEAGSTSDIPTGTCRTFILCILRAKQIPMRILSCTAWSSGRWRNVWSTTIHKSSAPSGCIMSP